MTRFTCRYCGASTEYTPGAAISKAITEHVYLCRARAAAGLDCEPGTVPFSEPGLDLPPVPSIEEALGLAVARNAKHSPICDGDDLRALVEAELLLSAHWSERHGCNCGRHLQGGTAGRF